MKIRQIVLPSLLMLALYPVHLFAGLDDLDDLDEEDSQEEQVKPAEKTKKELNYDEELQGKEIKSKPIPEKKTPAAKPQEKKKPLPYVSQKKVRTSPEKDKDAGKQPVKIKSKGLRALKNEGVLELQDDVVITQGNLLLTADYAKVYSNVDDDKQVEKIYVRGNVKISKSSEDPEERVVARGNEATFFNKTRKVILKGNAKLWRGSDLIKGKKIDYDMNTGWITVDSAEGIIDPEKSFESEQ